MASNVLQPGKIMTTKANRCASFYKMPSKSEKCRRVLQIWKHLNALVVGTKYIPELSVAFDCTFILFIYHFILHHQFL